MFCLFDINHLCVCVQYPNSVMYVEPATEMQMAYTNYVTVFFSSL